MSVLSLLTADQLREYEERGYLILRSFFSAAQAEKMLARAQQLLRDFKVEDNLTVFATGADKHVGDEYFLTSGDKVRFFFEPTSVDGVTLNRPKELAVNKIGHYLHELDQTFRLFSLENDKVKDLVRDLGAFVDPRVIQSMLIAKQPKIGSPVHSHRDATFLYTSPPSSLVGLWFALEKCSKTNGCLSFLPGSHKDAARGGERLVRVDGGKGGTTIVLHGERQGEKVDWDKEEGWVVEECEIGDLVVIHGSVIHRSEQNFSDKSRFIYTFHITEGTANWDKLNWLQPTEGKEFSKLAI